MRLTRIGKVTSNLSSNFTVYFLNISYSKELFETKYCYRKENPVTGQMNFTLLFFATKNTQNNEEI